MKEWILIPKQKNIRTGEKKPNQNARIPELERNGETSPHPTAQYIFVPGKMCRHAFAGNKFMFVGSVFNRTGLERAGFVTKFYNFDILQLQCLQVMSNLNETSSSGPLFDLFIE